MSIILLPLAVGGAIYSVVLFRKFLKYNSYSNLEWQEFLRTRRTLLSKAIYFNPVTGDVKSVRRGFSLPFFLFGDLVPLYHCQWKLFFKTEFVLLSLIILGSVVPVIGSIILRQLGTFSMARKYNNWYEDYLIEKGYILQKVTKVTEDI